MGLRRSLAKKISLGKKPWARFESAINDPGWQVVKDEGALAHSISKFDDPSKYVYRAVSEADWQRQVSEGALSTHGRGAHMPALFATTGTPGLSYIRAFERSRRSPMDFIRRRDAHVHEGRMLKIKIIDKDTWHIQHPTSPVRTTKDPGWAELARSDQSVSNVWTTDTIPIDRVEEAIKFRRVSKRGGKKNAWHLMQQSRPSTARAGGPPTHSKMARAAHYRSF